MCLTLDNATELGVAHRLHAQKHGRRIEAFTILTTRMRGHRHAVRPGVLAGQQLRGALVGQRLDGLPPFLDALDELRVRRHVRVVQLVQRIRHLDGAAALPLAVKISLPSPRSFPLSGGRRSSRGPA